MPTQKARRPAHSGYRSHLSFPQIKVLRKRLSGSPYKLELLALVTALRDYHTYLWCTPFTVYTDHRALIFIHQQKDTNRHLATWMDRIMDYDFKVSHIPVRENVFADALSRMYPSTWGIPQETKPHLPPNTPMSQTGTPAISATTINVINLIKVTEDTSASTEQLGHINQAHGEGHFGIKSVIAQLRFKDHNWPGQQSHVAAALVNCRICQQWNLAKMYVQRTPQHHRTTSKWTSSPAWTRPLKDILLSV